MDQQKAASPLRIGLIGAGPWARMVHAPSIAAHPGTELSAVWARRPAAARELADAHGVAVAADPDALIDAVDAVAFAVPPDVQADLAIRAARAGRHLVLDKPIAGNVERAEELADAASDVATLVVLTRRFAPETADWLATVRASDGWATGSVRWYGGGLLGGPYSHSPWRHERGAVLDVGPHSLDLLDAALGPIEDVVAAAHGEPDLWHLVLAHANGRTSTASLSLAMPLNPPVVEFTLYGTAGTQSFPPFATASTGCYARLLDDLLDMVRSGRTEHPCDVRRGLHVQRLIDKAERLAGQ